MNKWTHGVKFRENWILFEFIADSSSKRGTTVYLDLRSGPILCEVTFYYQKAATAEFGEINVYRC